ncbi:MAG: GGDEF domain-containing protein [Ruminococcus sp.]|nr:GGDEF domain-containing protein [Ruminococcus sp.]
MKTGLFELMKAVEQPQLIVRYLDSSSFDELLEIDLNTQSFRNLFHVSKKYALPLLEGNYKELFILMSEDLVHPDERESFVNLLSPDTIIHRLNTSEIKGLMCREARFRLVGGDWRWVEAVLLTGEQYGLPKNVFRMYIFDCHSRKARELGLTENPHVADYERNEMTGLLKKRAFIRDAEQRIKNTDRNWCLVSIDIENFKLFNEWYGHSEGDLLMVQIGAALSEAGRDTGGTAGYFGQDDFCLLIPYEMERVKDLFEQITLLVGSHGNSVGFLPAFGVCRVEPDTPLKLLIDRAFLASRVAKEGYHKRIRIFEESMSLRFDEEYHVITDFFRALRQNEIDFYLQPQCRASSGRIVGAEALTRWIKPDGKVIPPDLFIPVLEKRGLISDLDMYIWDRVCSWQRQWIGSGHTPLPVSVNVSVSDILHTDVPSIFGQLIEKYALEPRLIKIEITESSYIANTKLVSGAVHSLREKGFSVLMDDFGSGYSTLSMLKALSIDVIKLDAQFLDMDGGNETKSIHILESVTNMTKTIGLPVIVEGVETREQKEFLQDLGCRYIQGYYFYRPMPTPDYEKLIADPDRIDLSGISFKANQQFRIRELLDSSIYSDTMLNNILGSCALYSWHDGAVDIVRYNEQFYEAVDIPNFKDRLTDIRQYMTNGDRQRLSDLLSEAVGDRLNGSKGVLHFYKTDGTLTTFFMHFYYLHSDHNAKIFYGSAQNISRLSNLEKQMTMLARYSPDTVLFLDRSGSETPRLSVLFNGLEEELGLDFRELERLMNGTDSREDEPQNSPDALKALAKKIRRFEPFTAQLDVTDIRGRTLRLNVYGNDMTDDTGMQDYIVILQKAV